MQKDWEPNSVADNNLAREVAKLIANKRDHVKMMSGGDVTGIHVKLLEEILSVLAERREPREAVVKDIGMTSELINAWFMNWGDAFADSPGKERELSAIL